MGYADRVWVDFIEVGEIRVVRFWLLFMRLTLREPMVCWDGIFYPAFT